MALDEESKPITGFVTRNKTYCFQKLPMGLTTASSAFQRLISEILMPYIHDFCQVFINEALKSLTKVDIPVMQ
jgi:hypothetical protein